MPAPLRLTRPVTRAFAPRPAGGLPPDEMRFVTDLSAEFGTEVDPWLAGGGGGNSFVAMSRELLDCLDRPLPALDAALLAYHLPDVKITEVAGCYLASRCPGGPEVFSVSGQGVGAPFTALRILDSMRLAGELDDGAVFVLDQSAWEPEGAVTDSAVLLCTDSAGAVLDFLDDQPTVDPAAVLSARSPWRVLAGQQLAACLPAQFRARFDVRNGAPDQLCTSVWALLAQHWPIDRYTIVADYDPHSGRLYQAGLRPAHNR